MKQLLRKTLVCLSLGLMTCQPAAAAPPTTEEISRDGRPRLESRAGHSVDTATGAFVLDVSIASLQGGRIPLDFNLQHNSMLDSSPDAPVVNPSNGFRYGLGRGWHHSLEIGLSRAYTRDPVAGDIITVRTGAYISRFQFVAEGSPCQPIDPQNQTDALELISAIGADLQGLWRLRRTDGTTYLFSPDGDILAILNGNRMPIQFEKSSNGRVRKIYTVSKGLRQVQGSGTAAISSTLLLHSQSIAWTTNNGFSITEGIFGEIDHVEQEGGGEGLGIYTYFAFSNIQSTMNHATRSQPRLTRIYDPVTLTNLVNLTPNQTLATHGEVNYPFTIPATDAGHLLRITPEVHCSGSKPDIALISPTGTVLAIRSTWPGEVPQNKMTDRFLSEPLGGTWQLRVRDLNASGKSGIIKRIRIDRAVQPAAWVGFSYTGDGNGNRRITRSFDSGGRTIFRNFYDENGRVSSQETGSNPGETGTPPRTVFGYREQPNGDLITDVFDRTPQRNRTTYVHDPYFNLKSRVDPVGNWTAFTYDPSNFFRTSIKDPLGFITTFAYGANGRLLSMTEPGNRLTSFTHDIFPVDSINGFDPNTIRSYSLLTNDLTSVKLADTGSSQVVMGHYSPTGDYKDQRLVRMRIFNASGEMIFDRPASELQPGKLNDINDGLLVLGYAGSLSALAKAYMVNAAADAIRLTTSIGDAGNVTTITDPLNQTSTYKYDELSNLKSTRNALADPQNPQGQYYNKDGLVSTMVNKDNVGIEAGYDTKGNTTSLGYVGSGLPSGTPKETLEYDAFGRVTQMTDSAGNWVQFTYDPRGNVIKTRNMMGHEEISVYNDRDQLVSKSDAMGRTTHSTYDANGNLTLVRNAKDEITRYEYDGEDRLIRETNALNNTTVTAYDAAGNVASVTDAENNVDTFQYDAAGRTTASYRGGKLAATFIYNEVGQLVSSANGHGHTVLKNYDAAGQQTSVTDAMDRTTHSAYDEVGRMKKITDARNREYHKTYYRNDTVKEIRHGADAPTLFTYTAKNKVDSITTPGGRKTEFKYTANDLISEFIPPSKTKSQEYHYDGAGRLIRIGQPGVPDIHLELDDVGNVLVVSTQATGGPKVPKIIRTYDELNRQTSFTDAAGNTTHHVYGPCGQVVRIVYPDGKQVNYAYDRIKRLKTVTDWANRVTTYDYNPQDQITSIVFPNNTRRVFTYDQAALLASRTDYDAGGSIIVSYLYSHDKNGKILTEAAGQLTTPWTPTAMTMTYGSDNQLLTMNGSAITHDADGNMTQGIVSGSLAAIQWDGRNNLRQIGSTTYTYDVQDRLIGWQTGGNSMSLAVIPNSAGSMVMVSTPSSGLATQYVYGIGLAYEVTGDDITVHHYDERGNSIALSGNAGMVNGRIAYSPHGQIIQQTGVTDSLFKFGALFGVIHSPSGLNYMRFRWYSPEMMRFLSLDSVYGDIDLPTTLNRYVYGFGDPINYVDPGGELGFLAPLAVVVVAVIAGGSLAVANQAISNAITGDEHRWEDYLGAAIGGMLGGAVAVACSVCGGVLESVTADLLSAAFKGKAVDIAGLFTGAAGAIVGAGLGKALGKVKSIKALGGKIMAKFGGGGKQITNKIPRILTESERSARNSYINIGIGALKDLALAGPKGALDRFVTRPLKERLKAGPGGDGSAGAPNLDVGNAFKYINRAQSGTAANVGKGGEYTHYQTYLEALSLAGRPAPNPIMAIPAF